MPDASPSSAPKVSFPVTYQQFTRPQYNVDLSGTGTLTYDPSGPSYVFAGKPRAFFARQPIELLLQPGDIHSTVVRGREIMFSTRRGKSGKQNKPFVFFCRDETEAQTIAGLLPDALVTPPDAAHQFHAHLDQLESPVPLWRTITGILVTINIAMFVVLAAFFGAGWFEVTSIDPGTSIYAAFAASNGAVTTDGEWWRLLVSMFVHFGIIHLACNMWALWSAGLFVEKLLGRWGYLLAYMTSGIAGGFVSLWWNGDTIWSAGASGAVFGVYGVIVGFMWRQKRSIPPQVFQSILKSSVIFVGYNVLFGLSHSGIDQAAHVGGLLSGIGMGALLALPLDRDIRALHTKRKLQVGLASLVILSLGGLVVSPRFDYRLHEELQFVEANSRFVAEESTLMARLNRILQQLEKGDDVSAHGEWITTTLVPFYERLDHALGELPLDPDRRTAKKRDVLRQAFALRTTSLQHLAAAIAARDPQAGPNFNTEEKEFARELEKLKALDTP